MNQDPPKNVRHRIGLYIEIPVLKMTPLSAFCHAEVMRRGIRCVLKHGNVLWDEPFSPVATDEVLDVVNQVARFQNGSAVEPPSAGDALKPLFTFIHRIIRERMTEPGVQCFAYFNWFFVLADVSDLERGLSIIKLELERPDMLQCVEIAEIDPVENRCRTIYPPNCPKPFERHGSLVRQLVAYGQNLLQGGG